MWHSRQGPQFSSPQNALNVILHLHPQKPKIDFTCSFPSAKMKADEHERSERSRGKRGDKTVEVTSDAKETEMSFRLNARTSPPSLPSPRLCESQRRQISECHTCAPIEPTTDERQRPRRQPSGLYLSGRENSKSPGKWVQTRNVHGKPNRIRCGSQDRAGMEELPVCGKHTATHTHNWFGATWQNLCWAFHTCGHFLI